MSALFEKAGGALHPSIGRPLPAQVKIPALPVTSSASTQTSFSCLQHLSQPCRTRFMYRQSRVLCEIPLGHIWHRVCPLLNRAGFCLPISQAVYERMERELSRSPEQLCEGALTRKGLRGFGLVEPENHYNP